MTDAHANREFPMEPNDSAAPQTRHPPTTVADPAAPTAPRPPDGVQPLAAPTDPAAPTGNPTDGPAYLDHRRSLVGLGMTGHQVDDAAGRGLHPGAILSIFQKWSTAWPGVAPALGQIIADVVAALPTPRNPQTGERTPPKP